jgi:hypothetical protein
MAFASGMACAYFSALPSALILALRVRAFRCGRRSEAEACGQCRAHRKAPTDCGFS